MLLFLKTVLQIYIAIPGCFSATLGCFRPRDRCLLVHIPPHLKARGARDVDVFTDAGEEAGLGIAAKDDDVVGDLIGDEEEIARWIEGEVSGMISEG